MSDGTSPSALMREHARTIWQAAVAAVDPFELVRAALVQPSGELGGALAVAGRILVVGGGKAGAAMAAGVEAALGDRLECVTGVVNVPAESVRPLKSIRLHAARPAGTNQPTSEGIAGAQDILALVRSAGVEDVCLCLLSGGGSALLPAPVEGITLANKQQVTLLLHHCGATIDAMNCVRKHLSDLKGGRLAQAFRGRTLVSLIISDVIGDPLDVIASGPTAADPTTFADALAVLAGYGLRSQVAPAILAYLERGQAGEIPETLKTLPPNVHNFVLANNARALAAAQRTAQKLGYHVLNLGTSIQGETQQVATLFAGIVRSFRRDGQPLSLPVCVLAGGETTVTLGQEHGSGGRNQEFVLAMAEMLDTAGLRKVVVLSGGTDGEDGPTDAAGAIADTATLARAADSGLSPRAYLDRHDAYSFFKVTGDLLKTGLTQTNVMDVCVILIGGDG
jgi:hydroxypyruvate reductase/glycerate 2-kinase